MGSPSRVCSFRDKTQKPHVCRRVQKQESRVNGISSHCHGLRSSSVTWLPFLCGCVAVCAPLGNSVQVIWQCYYHFAKQFVGKLPLQILSLLSHCLLDICLFICCFPLVDELCMDSEYYFVFCIAAHLIFHSNYRKQYGDIP